MTKQERALLLAATLEGVHSLGRAPRLQVVSDLLGLQAQFARNPELSLRLRASDLDAAPWDAGLARVWSFRGTVHVVREDELGLYLSAAGHSREFQDSWWGMTQREQERWSPFLLEQIAGGNDTRDGLKRAALAAGMSEDLLGKAFHGWGGLIKEMTWRGLIVAHTGTEKRYRPAPPIRWMDRDEARSALVSAYFATFGPASVRDCAAFFQWPMRELNPLLPPILDELSVLELDGTRYYHARPLPEAAEPPECVLLPGFDQAVMAYKDRARLIAPENARRVVNEAGIVFPVAVLRGQARARWKEEKGRLTVTPFERLYKKDIAALRRAARRELGVREIAVEE